MQPRVAEEPFPESTTPYPAYGEGRGGDARRTTRVQSHDTPGDAGPRHRQDTRVSVTRIVSRAVILAAGNGDRFHNPTHDSKLLQPLLGQPILLRTLEAAYDAGLRSATVVLGYQADRVRALAEAGKPRGLDISFAINPEWRLENGVSA